MDHHSPHILHGVGGSRLTVVLPWPSKVGGSKAYVSNSINRAVSGSGHDQISFVSGGSLAVALTSALASSGHSVRIYSPENGRPSHLTEASRLGAEVTLLHGCHSVHEANGHEKVRSATRDPFNLHVDQTCPIWSHSYQPLIKSMYTTIREIRTSESSVDIIIPVGTGMLAAALERGLPGHCNVVSSGRVLLAAVDAPPICPWWAIKSIGPVNYGVALAARRRLQDVRTPVIALLTDQVSWAASAVRLYRRVFQTL